MLAPPILIIPGVPGAARLVVGPEIAGEFVTITEAVAAKKAAEQAVQLGALEDALIRTVEAAQAVSAGDILHDERTRQLADQIAAANRTLALNLTQRKP